MIFILDLCPAGQKLNDSNMCELCDIGFWKGEESDAKTCTECVSNITEHEGSTSAADCKIGKIYPQGFSCSSGNDFKYMKRGRLLRT